MEKNEAQSGLYDLNNGQLELECSFLSLPTEVHVHWKFKPKGATHWTAAPCTTHQKHQCNASALGEHRTTSTCGGSPSLSGSYRCQTNFQDELIYGTESVIEVVGLGEQFAVVEKKTREREAGFIEIEVCGNPKPQLFFVSDRLVLQPGDSAAGYAASPLSPALEPAGNSTDARKWKLGCFRSRLLIHEFARRRPAGGRRKPCPPTTLRTIPLLNGQTGVSVDFCLLSLLPLITLVVVA
ncbi:Ig-like domain-containing protein [Aphelenchoides fujianensis]|nr:Ig-like domain-containing protein [Aphelenchoides fujianensis]